MSCQRLVWCSTSRTPKIGCKWLGSCSVLQRVALCCSVLQRCVVPQYAIQIQGRTKSAANGSWVAVGCSGLQWVALCCSVLQRCRVPQYAIQIQGRTKSAANGSWVAVGCIELQRIQCSRMLVSIKERLRMVRGLQCVAVCCSGL